MKSLVTMLASLAFVTAALIWSGLESAEQRQTISSLRADLATTRSTLSQARIDFTSERLRRIRGEGDLDLQTVVIERLAAQLAAERPTLVESCYRGVHVIQYQTGVTQTGVEVCGWNMTWKPWDLPVRDD